VPYFKREIWTAHPSHRARCGRQRFRKTGDFFPAADSD